MVLPWSTAAVHILTTTVCFYSQSGDCWGMIGSIIALHQLRHIYCPLYEVRLNREHRRRDQGTGGYPSWIRPISLGNRKIDSMCEKMNPELESSQRANDTETGGFWRTDWESCKSWKELAALAKKQSSWSNNLEHRARRKCQLKANWGF